VLGQRVEDDVAPPVVDIAQLVDVGAPVGGREVGGDEMLGQGRGAQV
jgi:hypothetical protein